MVPEGIKITNMESFELAAVECAYKSRKRKTIYDSYIFVNKHVQLITKLHYLYWKILHFDCSEALEVASESPLHFYDNTLWVN